MVDLNKPYAVGTTELKEFADRWNANQEAQNTLRNRASNIVHGVTLDNSIAGWVGYVNGAGSGLNEGQKKQLDETRTTIEKAGKVSENQYEQTIAKARLDTAIHPQVKAVLELDHQVHQLRGQADILEKAGQGLIKNIIETRGKEITHKDPIRQAVQNLEDHGFKIPGTLKDQFHQAIGGQNEKLASQLKAMGNQPVTSTQDIRDANAQLNTLAKAEKEATSPEVKKIVEGQRKKIEEDLETRVAQIAEAAAKHQQRGGELDKLNAREGFQEKIADIKQTVSEPVQQKIEQKIDAVMSDVPVSAMYDTINVDRAAKLAQENKARQEAAAKEAAEKAAAEAPAKQRLDDIVKVLQRADTGQTSADNNGVLKGYNKDGKVGWTELREALNQPNPMDYKAAVAQRTKAFDLDGDGVVEKSEITRIVEAAKSDNFKMKAAELTQTLKVAGVTVVADNTQTGPTLVASSQSQNLDRSR